MSKIKHNDEYKKIRESIDHTFYNKENFTATTYEECLKRTKDFLHLIKTEGGNRYNFYWAYLMLSKIYNKLNDKKISQANFLRAEKFLDKDVKTEWILMEWQVGMYYKNINIKKALAYFNQALAESEKEKNNEYIGGILDEIAYIEKDIDKMTKAIRVYKSADIELIYKTNALDEMYGHLFELYIFHGNEIRAYETLHNINNKKLINELKERLNVIRLA